MTAAPVAFPHRLPTTGASPTEPPRDAWRFGLIDTPDAQARAVQLNQLAFGADAFPDAVGYAILTQRPLTCLGGYRDGTLQGWLSLWPLRLEDAAAFARGAVSELDLLSGDLARGPAVDPADQPVIWYVAGLVLDPALQGRGYGATLAAGAAAFWRRTICPPGPARLWAALWSPAGHAVAQRAGFVRLPGACTLEGWPVFECLLEAGLDRTAAREA